ncbi:MAG: two-component system sensor histidine kinase NtrB [Desulfosoma sp.]|uniref:two-component system sensor histidine kinase NtrB n=2 Tax=Desulfosoma sp. TaxID=2603217 RepID=UPI00404AC899
MTKASRAPWIAEANTAFQRTVHTHLVLRLLAAVFILAVTFLFQLRLSRDVSEPVLTPLYIYAAVLFSVTLLSACVLPIVHRHGLFAAGQFAFDVLAVTFLIYLTGGVTSPFPFLYMALIMAAAVLFQRRGSLWAAAVSTIAYGVLLDLQLYGWVHPLPFMGRAVSAVSSGVYLYNLAVTTSAFFLVAFISGYLAMELQKWARLSAEKSRDIERLESFYRRLVESLGAGLLTTDAHGLITYANRAAQKLLQVDASALEGQPLERVFPELQHHNPVTNAEKPFSKSLPEASEPADHRFSCTGFGTEGDVREKAQESPSSCRVLEIVRETPSGEQRSFVVTVSPLKTARPSQDRVIVFQDQTEIKALQERMRRLEQLAFAGKMAGEIVHDIKNPLAAISGAAQMMAAQGTQDDDVARRLQDILMREIDRLNTLVGRFLWIAREGKASEKPEPVAVAETVHQVLETLTMSKHLSNRHRVHVDVPQDLHVTLVPRHLFQILWHLVANAAEALPEGGHLQIGAYPHAHEDGRSGVLLKVADSGPGVSADVAHKIFDPLFTTKEGHLGLGLSLVHRLVDAAGGHVRVGSSAAFPMCVRVFLPQP